MNKAKDFFVCSCFYTHNIFLQQYNIHVTYFEDDDRFLREWKKTLSSKGCKTNDKIRETIEQIKAELARRKTLGQQFLDRREKIFENYTPLHPHIYNLQDSYFTKEFLDIVQYAKSNTATAEGLIQKLTTEHAEQVYSFPVFTEQFCQEFMEEISHFENTDLPKGRPNTMNNYGILLNELGFDEDFITPLRVDYLRPITRLLFPDWGGDCLDSHKAFIVKYKLGEDLALNYHYDNAEVTINVSLGREFSEGALYFGDMRWVPLQDTECSEYAHKPTYGLLHRGQHMHGAMRITEGERYNLIIWMRSSYIRNELCPMCGKKPTLVKTVGFGDGFTAPETINLCSTV
ncbi:2-oxoglutarate and iron-dependent oxygenase domain-containing protein 2-like [Glandiceps talaboti]